MCVCVNVYAFANMCVCLFVCMGRLRQDLREVEGEKKNGDDDESQTQGNTGDILSVCPRQPYSGPGPQPPALGPRPSAPGPQPPALGPRPPGGQRRGRLTFEETVLLTLPPTGSVHLCLTLRHTHTHTHTCTHTRTHTLSLFRRWNSIGDWLKHPTCSEISHQQHNDPSYLLWDDCKQWIID